MTISSRHILNTALLVFLGLIPFITDWMGDSFYTGLVARILILAIAALSLNLLIGYGGMVSFGHAAYIGVGAYCVGIARHCWDRLSLP